MSGKTEQGGTVFQYRSVVDKTWRDCDEVDADAYGQTGCHEVRRLYTHAERARVPAEFFTDLRKAKSAADRSQKINRLHVYGRVVERHIESLLASSATNADATGATP